MFETILEICREVNKDIPASPTVKLIDDGYIDSFGVFMILTRIELQYDIIIVEDEMSYANFQDIQHIEQLVTGKLAEK